MSSHDLEMERIVLGSVLDPYNALFALEAVTPILVAEDFYHPQHQRIYASIVARHASGLDASIAGLSETREFEHDVLADMWAKSWIPGLLPPACNTLVRLAQSRRLTSAFSEGVESLNREEDPTAVAERTVELIGTATAPRSGGSVAVQWGDVMAWDDSTSPWVLDGMMRRGHRGIIVASEGAGKTMALRQVALKASAGLHPFAHGRKLKGGPVKTLTVDLENPRDQIRQHGAWIMAGIRQELGSDFDASKMPAWLVDWPGRIDLRSRRDRLRLETELRTHRPELVVLGPLYRAFRKKGNESEEEAVGEVTEILDDMRVRFDLTMLFEHHAPHASGGGKREMRPTGSSYWLRWPEFGLSMQAEKTGPGEPAKYKLGRWRGDRVKAAWPEYLQWDKQYPFVGVYPTGTFGKDRDGEQF